MGQKHTTSSADTENRTQKTKKSEMRTTIFYKTDCQKHDKLLDELLKKAIKGIVKKILQLSCHFTNDNLLKNKFNLRNLFYIL